MTILWRCTECGILLSGDEAEAEDDPICSDCMVGQLLDDDDDDPDALPGDDRRPLTAPEGWGPSPMGSAKTARSSEVKPERSEP